MFKVRLIPCLDVKDGRVVKGVNFVNLRDAGDPVEAAIAYDAAGADELTFLDITASHENRGIILDVVAPHRGSLLHASDRRRRRAHHRGHPRAAARRRRQGVDQHRGGEQPAVRQGSGGKIRRSVHRGRDRRQESVAAGRTRPLGNLHPWRPQSDRDRCDRLRARGRRPRRRRNPADLDGPRRHQTRFRHSAHPRHRRRGAGAGDRLRRRRQSRSSGRRHPRRPRHRGAGGLDLSLRRVFDRSRPRSTWRRPDCRCGSTDSRAAGAGPWCRAATRRRCPWRTPRDRSAARR